MPTLRTVSLALRIASAQLLTLYYPLPQPRREVTPAALRKLVCEVSSCVVHFDGFRLSSSFLLPLAINVFSRENCPVAAKHGCPTPVAPGGDPYTRWLRLPSPYYAPSACSKMPRSILLVFDLDGVRIYVLYSAVQPWIYLDLFPAPAFVILRISQVRTRPPRHEA